MFQKGQSTSRKVVYKYPTSSSTAVGLSERPERTAVRWPKTRLSPTDVPVLSDVFPTRHYLTQSGKSVLVLSIETPAALVIPMILLVPSR
jgi:hypothetical protein